MMGSHRFYGQLTRLIKAGKCQFSCFIPAVARACQCGRTLVP